MNIELRRPFLRETGKSRFRATYRVTEVPEPGCVQVTVTLATRIQLQQQIARQGVKYTDAVLEECVKDLVKGYVENGGRLDPSCNTQPQADAIFLDYGDFDMLVAAAERNAAPRD